jgi:hypothetical protein
VGVYKRINPVNKDSTCIECLTETGDLIGTEFAMGRIYAKYVCMKCGERWYIALPIVPVEKKDETEVEKK